MRHSWILAACLIAGCDRNGAPPPPPPAALPSPEPASATHADRNLAYTHEISLSMDNAAVPARAKAARDRCEQAGPDQCILMSDDESSDGEDEDRTLSATMSFRLTHESIQPFIAALTAPMPDEHAGDPRILNRSVQAEDLTQPIADGERRLAQLRDYRDRLDALARRPDTKAEDLIRVAEQISKTQTELESATADQATLSRRVATEILNARLTSRAPAAGTFGPVRDVLKDAGRIFWVNAADGLRVLIAAVIWLPLVLVLGAILRVWLRRFGRRRAPAP